MTAPAQAGLILEAISDAAVNAALVDHFQTLARGHFTTYHLKRTYGKGTVRRGWGRIRAEKI